MSEEKRLNKIEKKVDKITGILKTMQETLDRIESFLTPLVPINIGKLDLLKSALTPQMTKVLRSLGKDTKWKNPMEIKEDTGIYKDTIATHLNKAYLFGLVLKRLNPNYQKDRCRFIYKLNPKISEDIKKLIFS